MLAQYIGYIPVMTVPSVVTYFFAEQAGTDADFYSMVHFILRLAEIVKILK